MRSTNATSDCVDSTTVCGSVNCNRGTCSVENSQTVCMCEAGRNT